MTPERYDRLTAVLDKRQNDLTVVLENVFDPHNISAVMRTCDAVGVQDIYILNTRIGRHKKWGKKSSSSASKWLTIHQFTDADACVDALRQRYDLILTTHLAGDAKSLYELDLSKKVALVFGNEHAGVSDEMLAKADGNFVIPQVGIIRSLNISVACAVTLYEAFRQKAAQGHYAEPRLDKEQLTVLRDRWGFIESEAADDIDPEITGIE
ncbi:MAG TPA: RNA methyltransferase [Dinghuibacter sp.]|jgi:tRNA (guanosine-2'-O-)-methyltransferase|uniref:TrmH family RNA methyltransferase n=1 Tax=Dinghuibacter sp. TaxID=2024697 RepID=UPI002B6784D0|nr:RNA methyltransferase [Dinghuibacter sp.]HTJ12555.1 RNA methyltransferase [Dinghuibacter sp.]